MTGGEIASVVKEVVTDQFVRHGKSYLGVALINISGTCISGVVPLVTNAMKVVKIAKTTH